MKVLRPATLSEAILTQQETKGYYIAGGTFSMVEIVADRFHPEHLIDLSLCRELYGVTEETDCVKVGALTTFTEIEKDEILNKYYPALTKASAEVGGPQVRNRGTVGGNICAASPAADCVPPLLALEATALVVGADGEREIPLNEMFLAPKKTCLTANEILVAVKIPKKGFKNSFIKVGKRNALAVSSVNMAVACKSENGCIEELVIAAGSCAPTPRCCPKTAEALLGEISTEKLEKAKELLMTEISPIDDRWATAEYRRLVACNMLESLISQLTEEE